jgi:hypothetical protein
MKAEPEYIEGSEAWERFQTAVKGILAVPHDEIQRRIEEHRKKAARNASLTSSRNAPPVLNCILPASKSGMLQFNFAPRCICQLAAQHTSR